MGIADLTGHFSLEDSMEVGLGYLIKGKVTMGKKIIIVFAGLLLLVQGCLGQKPLPMVPVPEGLPGAFLTAGKESRPSVQDRWWESFDSKELNLIVDNALDDNFTIREALARLDQARAVLGEKRSFLFPMLNLEAGASHNRTRKNGVKLTQDTFFAGPGASYEVDLWGGIRSGVMSGELLARASRLDLETAAMTLAAEIATTWVDLLAAIKELDLVKQQLITNTQMLELLKLRFENSLSTVLDVFQQEEVVARVNSQMPPLEKNIKALSNSLYFLQARAPAPVCPVAGMTFPTLPSLPEMGIPANLLVKRPDIRAAGSRLMAGQWDTAAESSARFPSLNLTGNMGLEGSGLDSLLNSWILSLGANIAATLFDGGKKAAAVDKAKAVVQERLATYEKTVFTALVEVEDALSREVHQRALLFSLDREIAAARRALGEATNRYQKGLETFLPLLSEQLNVQGLERGIILQQAELIKARIALHRALGGNWTENMELGRKL